MKKPTGKLGEILVQEGLINMNMLAEAQTIQASSDIYRPIGQIFVEMGVITSRQLNYILDQYSYRPALGELLIKEGRVNDSDIRAALKRQQEKGGRLGECLVELNLLSEKELMQALCKQLNVPFLDIDQISIDQKLSALINKKYCKRHGVLPIAKVGSVLTLAMEDPTDFSIVDELSAFTGLEINVAASYCGAIQRGLTRLYGEKIDSQQELESPKLFRIVDDLDEHEGSLDPLAPEEMQRADEIVEEILKIGIRHEASDIHIETYQRRLQVRFRVDGILNELPLGYIEGVMQGLTRQVISRIKIMGRLDIAEKRRPQDGSFSAILDSGGHTARADFRISVVPGYYGEHIVLRILDSRRAPKSIDELGFSPNIRDALKALMRRTSGIILVAGPTGSGKSTTLYGALMSCYRPEIKILTAEDPIEFVYNGITQCQVNTAIGNTFASYIRAFLRQDPEIILVGEIRDGETAEMAFRAAQTGHLVLSTVHTNDAIGVIPRLLDLGVEPNLISSCLSGVVAQRLVRRICPKCKAETVPDSDLVKEFFGAPPEDIRWVSGQKCSHCNHSGYRGRTTIAELWIPEEADILAMNKGLDIELLRESLYRSKVSTLMVEDAVLKLKTEQTTLEELSRVLPFSVVYQFRRRFGSSYPQGSTKAKKKFVSDQPLM
ncbi:MAG: type II secretion system protein GspE [Halochromatium sp.]|nr:type II secretion system protein GspE [Halochromatium sp.]